MWTIISISIDLLISNYFKLMKWNDRNRIIKIGRVGKKEERKNINDDLNK